MSNVEETIIDMYYPNVEPHTALLGVGTPAKHSPDAVRIVYRTGSIRLAVQWVFKPRAEDEWYVISSQKYFSERRARRRARKIIKVLERRYV